MYLVSSNSLMRKDESRVAGHDAARPGRRTNIVPPRH